MENTFIIIQTPTKPTSGLVQSEIKSHAMRHVHRRNGLPKTHTIQHRFKGQQFANGTSVSHLPAEDRSSVRFQQSRPLALYRPGNESRLPSTSPYRLKSWAEDSPDRVARQLTANRYPESVDEHRQQLDHHRRDTGGPQGYIWPALVARRFESICSADMVFGGLRHDPFQTYPIQAKEYFPAALDLMRPASIGPGYFQFMLQHDVLFEAFLAYTLCVRPVYKSNNARLMRYHYGGSLSKVSAQLLASGDTQDAVIMAVSNLAVISVGRLPVKHLRLLIIFNTDLQQ